MNLLLFGATGSAGGSVLDVCLASDPVREVRSIARRPLGIDHPKLRALVHDDFLDHAELEDVFEDLDACLFCLGVSATQVRDEDRYRRITVDFAVAAARAVRSGSPGARFQFISGMGTRADGRAMWARVKAEAEQRVMDEAGAVCWRPGFVDGARSDSGTWYQGVLRPAFRLLRPFRSLYVSGEDLGRAMLQATRKGIERRVVENREIREIAGRWDDRSA